jgi:hypothetical protein
MQQYDSLAPSLIAEAIVRWNTALGPRRGMEFYTCGICHANMPSDTVVLKYRSDVQGDSATFGWRYQNANDPSFPDQPRHFVQFNPNYYTAAILPLYKGNLGVRNAMVSALVHELGHVLGLARK